MPIKIGLVFSVFYVYYYNLMYCTGTCNIVIIIYLPNFYDLFYTYTNYNLFYAAYILLNIPSITKRTYIKRTNHIIMVEKSQW